MNTNSGTGLLGKLSGGQRQTGGGEFLRSTSHVLHDSDVEKQVPTYWAVTLRLVSASVEEASPVAASAAPVEAQEVA